MTNLEYERRRPGTGWRLAALALTALQLVLILGVCASTALPHPDPLAQVQREAWEAPWAMCPGDWEAKQTCSCRNRALWIAEVLEARGHEVTQMVGYRANRPKTLHMVPLVDGSLVIDYDGVHPVEEYRRQWTYDIWYDWRIPHALWLASSDEDR